MEEQTTPKNDLKTMAIIVYACWAAGIFSSVLSLVGIMPLVAALLAYLKMKDAAGTIYHSHFVWVFRTFVIGIIIGFVGTALLMIPFIHFIGLFVLIAVGLWSIYRLVKGGLKLYENKAIENPEGFI